MAHVPLAVIQLSRIVTLVQLKMSCPYSQPNNWLLTLQLEDPEINRISKLLEPDIEHDLMRLKRRHLCLKIINYAV